jgi:hypothetical protein
VETAFEFSAALRNQRQAVSLTTITRSQFDGDVHGFLDVPTSGVYYLPQEGMKVVLAGINEENLIPLVTSHRAPTCYGLSSETTGTSAVCRMGDRLCTSPVS